MAKVYMVRHQKAGILSSHVFAKSPTPEQMAPIVKECERLHGAEVNGEKAWVIVHEAELFVDEVPVIAAPATNGLDGPPKLSVRADGTVTPPGEKVTITSSDVITVTADELLKK